MKKQSINMEVSEVDLDHSLKNILLLEKLFVLEIKKIYEIEKGITEINHYIMSIANRAISLNRGFVTLANANNYLTAISLMRLQIDNCLRLYAMSLSGDSSLFYKEILSGKHVRNLEDRDGKKMSDTHLTKKIDKIFPGFKSLYDKLSGYIHFSFEHFSFNNSVENETLSITIGAIENLEIHKKVDFAHNMFLIGKDLLKIISEYRNEIKD
jgi:hypothetical protein